MKRLAGYDNLYRIRIGKWRIVFCREMGGNKVLKIESRGDAYK
jgi:mRNA-degrading endonuclease RelE of RelBE toxin-antitoxin system